MKTMNKDFEEGGQRMNQNEKQVYIVKFLKRKGKGMTKTINKRF